MNETHEEFQPDKNFRVQFRDDLVDSRTIRPKLADGLIHNLRLFRIKYPCCRKEISGVHWEYILAGEGYPAVILLPGILGSAESTWQLIQLLAKDHQVLAVTYPALNTTSEMVDGLAALLKILLVEKAVVYGGSYGGFVAQVFVREYPELVTKLILSHTTPPDPWRGKKARSVAPLFKWLPASVSRLLFRQVLKNLLIGHQRPILRRYFRELINRQMSKRVIASTCQRMVDFDSCYRFAPDDLRKWSGKILLLLSDDDPLTPQPVRQHLQLLYPGATLRLFSGSGHLSAILKQDEIAQVIKEFIYDPG